MFPCLSTPSAVESETVSPFPAGALFMTVPVEAPCCVELHAAISAANAKNVKPIANFFILSSIHEPNVVFRRAQRTRRTCADTRLRKPFLSPMRIGPKNTQTHYGCRRIRSEMRGSEGKLVETRADHEHTHFAKTKSPQWSMAEESPGKPGPAPKHGLSEAQSWMRQSCLFCNPRRSTVWPQQLEGCRLSARRFCSNPSCRACCTRRLQNSERLRQTCYLSAPARGITMQAASSFATHYSTLINAVDFLPLPEVDHHAKALCIFSKIRAPAFC